MEKAATDISSFRVLRENGFTYVDKTAQVRAAVGAEGVREHPEWLGK